MTSLYLINPKSDPLAYFGTDVHAGWGLTPATLIADLVTPTVAAFVPEGIDVTLCDENVTRINFDHDADVVALTGRINQTRRMLEIAREFRRRGKVVMIGGPVATLDPDVVRDDCDILVQGELEGIAENLFADIAKGAWRSHYKGSRTSLAETPIPRWDLYPNEHAYSGSVQTSRGCPFTCEFCDVPAFVGRAQRHKPPEKVIAELDVLYGLGYREVFLADDNFTANRKRAKALLEALRHWNESREHGPVGFSTQLSLDAARDPELLDLCARAGIEMVFIGIETPNMESLNAAGKRQNVVDDLNIEIQRFLDHHIVVLGGMIVGFDTDGPDIFDMHRKFIAASAVPVFSLGTLIAPAGTPLRDRLAREGRLIDDDFSCTANPWYTNIVPMQMSREHLVSGLRQLCHDIYSPEAFGARVEAMVERLGSYRGPTGKRQFLRPEHLRRDRETLIKTVATLGPAEKRMTKRIIKAVMKHNPGALGAVQAALRFYAQIRYVYDLMEKEASTNTNRATRAG